MQYATLLLATASLVAAEASYSSGNYVQFINQGSSAKTVVFTANADLGMTMPDLHIEAGKAHNVSFADNFIGNFWSYDDAAPASSGMLGEVSFNQWPDASTAYFDVSSIVNKTDNVGVKMLYPVDTEVDFAATLVEGFVSTLFSGCATEDSMACANQYNAPNDVRTISTTSPGLTCILGTPSTGPVKQKKRHAHHPHHFVA